ncbi:sulfite exporter TauE/SafE family protein [Aurantibacter sp.]|uniref:sulfite exporter TauE/SafE family protein n=1 Tax=Aurantibacter sp. TaxID=2807103 RepID=UPI0035C7DA70
MLLSALLLGLFGSFHCIGMCGPIAFLLPLDKTNKLKKGFQLFSYHFGRLTTYAFLGLVFGLLGRSLYLFGLQQRVSIVLGVIMVLSVILPKKLSTSNWFTPMYQLVSKVKSLIGFNLKNKSVSSFFIIGLLNGLLPCGLVYIAVFGAIGLGKLFEGSLYMAVFGLGTIPLMTSVIYLGNYLSQPIKQRVLKLIPVFVVIVGLLFVLRGLGLGIPYISPAETVTVKSVNSLQNCH